MQWARRTASEIRIAFEIHASWLNQVEIYFSVVQRKVLTPNDFTSLAEVEDRLLRFSSTTRRPPSPSSGSSLAATSEGCSRGLRLPKPTRFLAPPEYVTELTGQSTKPSPATTARISSRRTHSSGE